MSPPLVASMPPSWLCFPVLHGPRLVLVSLLSWMMARHACQLAGDGFKGLLCSLGLEKALLSKDPNSE